MRGLFILSGAPMRRIEGYVPLSYGVARVDDRQRHYLCDQRRSGDAQREYGLHTTISDRSVRWNRLGEKVPTLARVANGWQINTDAMGVCGNYYLKRAIVAMAGPSAIPVEDAIYRSIRRTAPHRRQQVRASFHTGRTAPGRRILVNTMYGAEGFQVANPIGRFAIGDRDCAEVQPDGSLAVCPASVKRRAAMRPRMTAIGV